MERTWKPKAGGILSIISGCIQIWWGIMAAFFGGFMKGLGAGFAGGVEMWESWTGEIAPEIAAMTPDVISIIGTTALIIGIVLLVFGIIALVGGIYAIKRRRWGLALAGAILSFPFLPLGAILGLLAIIFISRGKEEFE